jgi:galactonate dehydratase
MKIASVSTPVHSGWRRFRFRARNRAGIVGWGEAYSQYDRDRAVAAQVRAWPLSRRARPFQLRQILQIAFDDYAQRRLARAYCATSGIEQALWDIIGKAKQPVYNLIGGLCCSRVRVYANGWSYKMQKPEDFARGAESVRSGFTALKFDPVPGPWRTFVPKDHIRRAAKVLRAGRDAVGPDVDILLDIHRRLAPMHAIDLADAGDSSRTGSRNPVSLNVRRSPTSGVGAAFCRDRRSAYTRADFRRSFARAVDIINPDVSNCGGTELMYIAAAAETEAIAVSPHNYNSTTLALSATVHASACMPNFIITEYFLPFEELGQRLCPNVLKPVDGYITLPEGPGLGLTVDETAVRAAKGQQFPARTLRSPADEGP